MILLDTCTLLWLSSEPKRLSATACRLLETYADRLFLSSISAFEIALKARKKRLTLPLPPREWIDAVLQYHGISEVPVDCEIATRAVALPLLHDDPCDRFIIATALVHSLNLLTPDTLIRQYRDVAVRW